MYLDFNGFTVISLLILSTLPTIEEYIIFPTLYVPVPLFLLFGIQPYFMYTSWSVILSPGNTKSEFSVVSCLVSISIFIYNCFKTLCYYPPEIKIKRGNGLISHSQPSINQMSKIIKLSIRYVPDFYYKRIHYYSDHVKYMTSVIDKLYNNKKILIGASIFPCDQAIWYFTDLEMEEVKTILEDDPFQKAGLVEKWDFIEMEQFGRTSVEGMASLYEYSCV
jgi:hypothetical protein